MVITDKKSNYDTDVFTPLIEEIETLTNTTYGSTGKTDIAIRVIADHLRTVYFAVADGQLPSNTGAGYVIRRILRRAIRYGFTFLKQTRPFIHLLVKILSQQMGKAFPELMKEEQLAFNVIKEEENSFLKTLDQGLVLLDSVIKETNGKIVNGSKAFELYDTFGFPFDSDNEISLKNIILERLMGYDGLSSENINLIIDNCKLDRVKLNNELDKIETFFKDKKIINFKLQDLLNINENDDFNLLKDAALSGNNKKTNKLLSDTVMENDKVLFYLNSINQRLFKLNDIYSVKNKPITQVLSDMRPPIFWKDRPNVIEQTKKWNSKKIKNVLGKTFELEVRFKSDAALDKNVAIKKLLIDICNQANF